MLAFPVFAQAQIDSEFWFVAPDLAKDHGEKPILLRLSSFESPVQVRISQPANPSFVPIIKNLEANEAASVDISDFFDQVENIPVNIINNKGLLIQSTGLISVYYDIANPLNGDMFSLKGKNALGLAFHVPFQNSWHNNNGNSSFDLVATEDNTTITINPTEDIVGHKKNVPFSIVLHKGQTFSCQAVSAMGGGHLGGSFVTADKPIAITVHDDSMNPGVGGCRDTAGDQLIPDKKAGQEFIVLKGFLYAPDNFYVLAIYNNTVVMLDGQPVDTLDAGQSYRNILTKSTAYVTTTRPVHLFHITGFGCEVGGAIIPTIICTGSKKVSITRATNQFLSINIVAPSQIIGFFQFNGRSDVITASQFAPVPGTGGAWSYAKIALSTTVFPVGIAASITNSSGKFQLGFIHGDEASTCRYAYFSDFGSGDLQLSVSPPPYCQGSDVVMKASSTVSQQFTWRGPNGFTAEGTSVRLQAIRPQQSGYYVVSTVGADCNEIMDSIYVQVKGVQIERSGFSLCQGQSHQLPSGKVVRTGGEIRDTLRYQSGCDSVIHIYNVLIKPVPQLSLSKSNDVNCEIGTVHLKARGASTYQWSPAATLNNAFVSDPIARPVAATNYVVKGTASNGCSSTDSITVTTAKDFEGDGHSVPSAFTPNGDGRNDCFGVPYWGWVKDFSMLVYSRWGELVFSSKDVAQCWNGTYKGKAQQSDVFVYIIKASTSCGPVERKGTVVLIR